MCLAAITSRPTPTNEVVEVWKGFSVIWDYRSSTRIRGLQFYHFGNSRPLPVGKWIKASKGVIPMPYDWSVKSYPKGFHAYVSKRTAKQSYRHVIPVKFRKVHTHGRQDGKILVAYEMKIPKDWRKYLRAK